MKFGIFFSLLLMSYAAFADGGIRPKKFQCRYSRRELVTEALQAADTYAKTVSSNPQMKSVVALPSATIYHLINDPLFDLTVTIPFQIQTTEGSATVVSLFPGETDAKTAVYEDMVIPFQVQDTGPKKKCRYVEAKDMALSEDQERLLPIYKVVTTSEPLTVLDEKNSQDLK